MEVRHDEGVAIRIGPEPCAVTREGDGEASAGEHIGQPWSRERVLSQAPTMYSDRKAILTGTSAQVPVRPGVVEDPGMCARSLRGGRSPVRP